MFAGDNRTMRRRQPIRLLSFLVHLLIDSLCRSLAVVLLLCYPKRPLGSAAFISLDIPGWFNLGTRVINRSRWLKKCCAAEIWDGRQIISFPVKKANAKWDARDVICDNYVTVAVTVEHGGHVTEQIDDCSRISTSADRPRHKQRAILVYWRRQCLTGCALQPATLRTRLTITIIINNNVVLMKCQY